MPALEPQDHAEVEVGQPAVRFIGAGGGDPAEFGPGGGIVALEQQAEPGLETRLAGDVALPAWLRATSSYSRRAAAGLAVVEEPVADGSGAEHLRNALLVDAQVIDGHLAVVGPESEPVGLGGIERKRVEVAGQQATVHGDLQPVVLPGDRHVVGLPGLHGGGPRMPHLLLVAIDGGGGVVAAETEVVTGPVPVLAVQEDGDLTLRAARDDAGVKGQAQVAGKRADETDVHVTDAVTPQLTVPDGPMPVIGSVVRTDGVAVEIVAEHFLPAEPGPGLLKPSPAAGGASTSASDAARTAAVLLRRRCLPSR